MVTLVAFLIGWIIANPEVWIIGVIIALVTVVVGKRAAREWIESKNLPRAIVKVMLRKKKMAKLLKEGCLKFQNAIKEKITECSKETRKKFLAKIEESVDREIECLSAIDQL